jgi:hypothetical protein
VLAPHYDLIDQSGVDAQATLDAWLLKLEAIVRRGQGSTFFATTAGIEYTLYQAFDSAADLGLICEYHFDGRDAGAPPTFFDEDLMGGARLGFNDADDTSLLAAAIVDLTTRTTLASVEFASRISEGWRLEIEARFLPFVANGSQEAAFEREHVIAIKLQRFVAE